MDTMTLVESYHETNPFQLTQETINAYKTAFNQFFLFHRKKEYDEIVTADIEEWLSKLKAGGSSPITIKKKRIALRSFYRFCIHQGLLEVNPAYKEPDPLPLLKYWVLNNEKLDAQSVEWVNTFLLLLKLENMAKTYIDCLRLFYGMFLSEMMIPLDKITIEDMHSWLKEKKETKSLGTLNNYYSHLKILYDFCLSRGYVERIPLKKSWRPKIRQYVSIGLNEFDYSRVNIALDHASPRDQALVKFFLSTGCRVSEIAQLNINNIDLEKKVAKVHGKGGKPREVYFSEDAAYSLQKLLKNHPCNESALFLNKKGERLSRNGIRYILLKIGKQAELTNNFNPHVCRHTFASGMSYKGADIELIRQLLDHEYHQTTNIYLNIFPEIIKLFYDKIME